MRTSIGRTVITGRILTEAGVYMCAFGLAIGLVFPYFVVLLGVESAVAFQPLFVLSTVVAGMVVGVVGTFIVRRTVGRPLRRVAESMTHVRDQIAHANSTGDQSTIAAEDTRLDIASNDELGDCARSFNTLLDELARTRGLDERIRRLSVQLSEHLEPSRLGQIALDHLVVNGAFDAGAVLVLDRDEIVVVSSSGITRPHELADHQVIREVIEQGRHRRIECGDDIVIDGAIVDIRPRSIEIRALASHGVAFGALLLASTNEVEEVERRLVDASTLSLSMSLRNALTHQEVEQLAAIDALTGLYNRRLGLQRLDEEYARAERSRTPLSVVLFDIDHFKQVNDTYGHLAGDRVLRAVADAAATITREGDTLVRLGGEEFLAILPGASVADAVAIAERMRRAVADRVVAHGELALTVTSSFGVVSTPHPAVFAGGHLIARADEAMYAAKRAGRDRVMVSDAADATSLAG